MSAGSSAQDSGSKVYLNASAKVRSLSIGLHLGSHHRLFDCVNTVYRGGAARSYSTPAVVLISHSASRIEETRRWHCKGISIGSLRLRF